jgi:hypothetical protein
MIPRITLSSALVDPNLFGGVFGAESFWAWRTVAKLIDGAPLLEPREIELFKKCTGRTRLPSTPVPRLILVAGRRAGKDRFLSLVLAQFGAQPCVPTGVSTSVLASRQLCSC